MIYLYSGTPGSGKSLHQARIIEAWLKLGKPVIANYHIDTSLIKKCKGEFTEVNVFKLTPEELKKYSSQYFKEHKFKEGTIRLFIDEAQLIFNSRDWTHAGRGKWLEFFTQHRKYGYDIFLIAQFDRMLDKQLRSLIEYEVIHRKIKNFGLKGKILSLLAGGGLFVAVKIWYPMKEKTGAEFFKYSRRLAALYNSYQDFSQDVQPDPPPQDPKNKKQRKQPPVEIKQNKEKTVSEPEEAVGQESLELQELVKLFSA